MTLKPGRLFIAESFDLNILYSPLQELFPNKMQPPSPIKTCTCVTGQIPAWGRDSAYLCRAQTATPLHHCKSCGNVLVCWWCPAPQAGTYLDPVMQWVVHCWEEWKGSRAVLLLALRRAQGVEFRVLERKHQETSLCSRTEEKNNKNTADKSQPNLSESSMGLTVPSIVSLRKMVCSSVEECTAPCCTFHAVIPRHPICSQPATGSSPSSQ